MANAPTTEAVLQHEPTAIERIRDDRRALLDRPRLRHAIGSAGFDAVVACSTPNVVYSGGAFIQTPILSTFVLTTADDQQAVVVNEADAYVFAESSWISDVRSFPFLGMDESAAVALDVLADLLRETSLDVAVIGIDQNAVSWTAARQLERAMPEVEWRDSAALFERVRAVKTPAEIDVLRRAAAQTDRAIGATFAMSRVGDTETSFAIELQANLLRREADAISHAHVQFGVRSTIAHSLSAPVPCRPGDVLHVDAGGRYLGYHSDVSRNAIVGRPTRRQAEIYSLLAEIRQALLEAIRPGLIAAEVHALATRLFAERGLRHPWATLGHSVGLSLHEGFEIAADTDAEIQENMVLAIEPSHIERRDARYDIEDMILVTATGVERLSAFDGREMFEIR